MMNLVTHDAKESEFLEFSAPAVMTAAGVVDWKA
jgi:hypothetical protein